MQEEKNKVYFTSLLLESILFANGKTIDPQSLVVLSGQELSDAKQTGNNCASLLPINEENPWFLIGASVTGNGHKATSTPCQDSHIIEVWGRGWGVAVVSDGAGSAKKSHFASAFVTRESAKQALNLVKTKKWMEADALPDEEEWDNEARKLMIKIQEALKGYSKELKSPIQDMHATLIMVIFSPIGLLLVHVGDGRAGCINKEGNPESIMNPFEGEQVGETVFITMDLEKHKDIVETRIINEAVGAFYLLSDGCENVCWQTIQKDEETNMYFKPNKPFAPFFRQTIMALESMQSQETVGQLMENWYNYLDNGHKGFQTETDDKTMLIGIWLATHNK